MNREDFVAVFRSVVDRVDPETAVASAVHMSDGVVTIGDVSFDGFSGTPVVIALGKGSCAMARGVAASVGPVRGIAVSDHEEASPVEVVVGGHPIPDERSVVAGKRLLEVARMAGEDELVVFCISGGGSALAEVPVLGLGVDDLSALNSALIASGLPIEDVNEVRASISQIKGGRLAQACPARQRVTLVLSDVVGAGPEAVASGPSLGHGLGAVPTEMISRLSAGGSFTPAVEAAVRESAPATSTDPQPFVVVGSPETSALHAVEAFADRGVEAQVWTSSLVGDVEPAVSGMIDRITRLRSPMGVVVATGEVTVRISGTGLGGRNQHAALLAAKAIEGTDAVFGAFGTDGRDGPTNAAGAVVDGGTVERMARNNVGIDEAIRTFSSNAALAASDDLVITGPTGTNVADLWMAGRLG